jgi:hypothetical protein
LLRYVPSGTYFARIRVGGKLIRRSLESTVLSVAKLKLADLEKEERTRLENHQQFGSGKATFSDLLVEYRTRLEAIRVDELKDSGRVAGCRARRLPIGNAQVFDKLDMVRSAEDIVAKNRIRAATQSRDGVWGTPPLFL